MKILLVPLFLLYLTDGMQNISVRIDGEIDVRWLNIFKPKKVERRLNYDNHFVTKAKQYKEEIRKDQNFKKLKKEYTLSVTKNEHNNKPYKKVKLIHKPEFSSSSEISSSAIQSDSASINNYKPFGYHRHKKSKTKMTKKQLKIKERLKLRNNKHSYRKNLRRQEEDVIITVTGRIYNKHLEILNKILNITDINNLRSKAEFTTASYKEMLSNYLKNVRESNKWTDGDDANKVVLDTIDTSSSMLSTTVQFLIGSIKKMKTYGKLRQLDHIDKRMAEIRRLLEDEPKESYFYACQRLGICRHGQGFIMFAKEMFSKVLQNDNEKLKRFHDSFVAITRYADFSGIVNETFNTQMHVYINKVYAIPALVIRGMYTDFVKSLKQRSENRNIVYSDATNSPVIELVDILDTIIMPTEENKNEWEKFMRMIIDWTEGRRIDVDVIIQLIFGHILIKGQEANQIIEAVNVTTIDFLNLIDNKTTTTTTLLSSRTSNTTQTSEHKNIEEETTTDTVKTTKTSKTLPNIKTTVETLPQHTYDDEYDDNTTQSVNTDATPTKAITLPKYTYDVEYDDNTTESVNTDATPTKAITLSKHTYDDEYDDNTTQSINTDATPTKAINIESEAPKNTTSDKVTTPDAKQYDSIDETTKKTEPEKPPGGNEPLKLIIKSNNTKSETTIADYEETTCPHLASANFTNLGTRSITPLINAVATKTEKVPTVVSEISTIASSAITSTTMMGTNGTISSTTQLTFDQIFNSFKRI